jgi:hypothetical protein
MYVLLIAKARHAAPNCRPRSLAAAAGRAGLPGAGAAAERPRGWATRVRAPGARPAPTSLNRPVHMHSCPPLSRHVSAPCPPATCHSQAPHLSDAPKSGLAETSSRRSLQRWRPSCDMRAPSAHPSPHHQAARGPARRTACTPWSPSRPSRPPRRRRYCAATSRARCGRPRPWRRQQMQRRLAPGPPLNWRHWAPLG